MLVRVSTPGWHWSAVVTWCVGVLSSTQSKSIIMKYHDHPPVNIHVLPRWVISAEQCVIDYQSCIHQDKLLDCSRYIHPLENLTIELGLHHFYLHDTEASKAKFQVTKVVVALHTGEIIVLQILAFCS